MSKHPKPATRRALVLGTVALIAAFIVSQYQLQMLAMVGYLCTCVDLWAYHESPRVLAYMERQWHTWPELEAQPIPELAAENFTRETFWEMSNNLRRPVVIRGALRNTAAVNEWGQEFFVKHYA